MTDTQFVCSFRFPFLLVLNVSCCFVVRSSWVFFGEYVKAEEVGVDWAKVVTKSVILVTTSKKYGY